MNGSSSYCCWSCNHCLSSHFIGGVETADTTRLSDTAKEHAAVFGHSVRAKKVVDGELVRDTHWGASIAIKAGWISPAGDIIKG